MGVPLDMVTLTQYDSRVECFEVRYQDSIVSSFLMNDASFDDEV